MNFVFDLYGTLIDIWTDETKDELWEGVALLLGDGEDRAEQVKSEYHSLCLDAHRGDYHEIDLGGVFEKMLINRGLDASLMPYLASEFRRMSIVRLGCFSWVKTMLRQLKKKGCGVYLLSNAQACFTIEELRTCGLYDFFDGIAISSDMGVKKPSSDAFITALNIFDIDADSCIYVGNDLRDDILGATNVGMKTVYIHTAQSGSYPLVKLAEPTYRVENHKEMKELLLTLADNT